MDNYKNYHPDADDTLCCEDCGKKIEEPSIFAEGTEFEKEVNICTKCLLSQIGVTSFAIL